MKAYVLHGVNDLRLEETAVPEPGKGEVLVRVKAMGVCGSDIPRIYRTGAYTHPLIPGHEFSGIVEKTGEGVDAVWRKRRVGIFPLLPCGKCSPCREKKYELCRNYNYLGSRKNGGFAEYVSVPAWNLIELPPQISFEEAAMMEPMAVAVHAIKKAAPQKDDAVAVCGMGTIGSLTAMFLKAEGISDLFVIGNKALQKKAACRMGISEANFCDIRECDPEAWIAGKTGGEGVNVFFDCVGTSAALSLAIKSCGINGVVQAVGNPASDMELEKNIYWKILRSQLTVRGTWNSSFTGEADDDWHNVLEKLKKGAVDPKVLISHRFPFECLERGIGMMNDKTEEYVKVMGNISSL